MLSPVCVVRFNAYSIRKWSKPHAVNVCPWGIIDYTSPATIRTNIYIYICVFTNIVITRRHAAMRQNRCLVSEKHDRRVYDARVDCGIFVWRPFDRTHEVTSGALLWTSKHALMLAHCAACESHRSRRKSLLWMTVGLMVDALMRKWRLDG